jgi:hypothetical protein
MMTPFNRKLTAIRDVAQRIELRRADDREQPAISRQTENASRRWLQRFRQAFVDSYFLITVEA